MNNIYCAFKLKQWIYLIISQSLISGFLILQINKLPETELVITFFNVPVGDGMLIETPEGHNIVIDGGIDAFMVEKIFQKKSFFNNQIDLLIVTHPDADHLNGAYAILQNFAVKMILITGIECANPLNKTFIDEAKIKNIPIFYANSLIDWRIGELILNIIHPFKSLEGQFFKNANTASIVIKMEYGKNRILLTGDIEKITETAILKTAQSIESDIIKIAHHGSRSSSIKKFIIGVNPQLAIIPAGPDNKFNHPHIETVERLMLEHIPVLITKEVGEIVIKMNYEEFQSF